MSETAARCDHRCVHCGATDVTREAWAQWDRRRQDWTVREVFDFAFCHACHRQTRVEIRPIG